MEGNVVIITRRKRVTRSYEHAGEFFLIGVFDNETEALKIYKDASQQYGSSNVNYDEIKLNEPMNKLIDSVGWQKI